MIVTAIFAVLSLLVLIAGIAYRARRVAERQEALTDDMIRRIEAEGRLETPGEEPLDWEEIRAEEERFWEETWDEPEEL